MHSPFSVKKERRNTALLVHVNLTHIKKPTDNLLVLSGQILKLVVRLKLSQLFANVRSHVRRCIAFRRRRRSTITALRSGAVRFLPRDRWGGSRWWRQWVGGGRILLRESSETKTSGMGGELLLDREWVLWCHWSLSHMRLWIAPPALGLET